MGKDVATSLGIMGKLNLEILGILPEYSIMVDLSRF